MTQMEHAAGDEQALCSLESLVRGRCGMVFKHSRRDSFLQAVTEALPRFRCSSPQSLLAYFQSGAEGQEALEQFILSLTVGETYFWRNRPQFEALENVIIPDLVSRIRDPQRLNVWSAACSTGEEPYSLSILFHKSLGLQTNPSVQILGTDLNPAALATAREALYPPWSFRDTPSDFQERYFSPVGTRWQLRPQIRSAVTFRLLNLMAPETWSAAGIEKMDLILCRNVLIYFDTAGAERVIRALYETLNEGGWLVLGHADTFQLATQLFSVRTLPSAIVYQKKVEDPPFPRATQGVAHQQPSVRLSSGAPLVGPPLNTGLVEAAWSGMQARAGHPYPTRPPHPAAHTSGDSGVHPKLSPVRGPRTAQDGNESLGTPRSTVRQTALPDPSSTRDRAPAHAPSGETAPQTSARLEPILACFRAHQADEGLTRLAGLGAREKLTAEEMCQVAEALAGQHLLEQAEAWCSRAIAQESQNARGYYLLGLVRSSRGQLNPAIQALRKAVYLRPEYPLAHLALSEALNRAGERHRARKELELVLDLLAHAPEDAQVPESNGLTVRQLRTLVEARQRL